MKRLVLNRRGDTLIEVVLALVILSSVLVGGFGVVRFTRVQTQNASQRSQAINMVQEQFNALRAFRDANPYGWPGFVGRLATCAGPCSSYTLGSSGAVTSSYNPTHSTCILTAPTPDCSFHMERDSRPASPAYGQWVPCPGPWNPPLGSDDPGWKTPPGLPDAYSTALYASYGCAGNARTTASQPNISVSIQPTTGQVCNILAPDQAGTSYFSFSITATWQGGGSNLSSSSTISSTLANLKDSGLC